MLGNFNRTEQEINERELAALVTMTRQSMTGFQLAAELWVRE